MRTLLITIAIVCASLIVHSQTKVDTVYLNAKFSKTSKKKAEFYCCVTKDTLNFFLVKQYKTSGVICETGRYADKKLQIPHGLKTTYYPNGKVKNEVMYDKGRISGVVKSFYENGNIKRIENYNSDVLNAGKYYTINGLDTTLMPYLQMPRYKNGMASMYQLIDNKKSIPIEAQQRRLDGVAYVGFVVNAKGRLENVVVVQSTHAMFNSEAVRLVSMTDGDWIPGIKDGEIVSMAVTIPLTFKAN